MGVGKGDPAHSVQNEQAWRFLLAGLSNMTGASVTNPIDVIKIRMQLDNEMAVSQNRVLGALQDRYYKGLLRGSMRIVHDEGVPGLYKGLTASLMREGSYSAIRMGAYEPMKRVFGATDPAHTSLWIKICAGACSGAVGSAVATPCDLVKVRQQAEGRDVSKRYRSTLSAFGAIYRAAGLRGLYVGIGPTVQRATILTATQIPSYDHTKHTLLNLGWFTEWTRLHVISSMVAGFMSALTTSPVDVMKTRVMNQKGKALYTSTWDCFVKTLKVEGPLAFYKGFFPNWMRIGPHTVVTFFIFEKLRKMVGIDPI